ncbi:response regulator [Nocardioides coralli]|uniref:response regulator n=1 Tax=Nocardioides coralli TaxID=2872154 RepID=UPI001CA3A0A5|nr:response regulator transcription factor [Nocardioides coralli]QZY28890.1 response regulator transcription factor [Nocardioides coralli]
MGLGKLFGRKDPEPAPAPVEEDQEIAGLKVVIVDDDPDARDFMRMGLEVGGFEVVGEGGDGASALQAVQDHQPDLVLVDLHMPDIGGLELLPRLKEAHWAAKYVVVSAIGATRMVEAAMEAGAVGFIEKGVSPRSINLHLQKVAAAGSVKVVRPYPLNHEYP